MVNGKKLFYISADIEGVTDVTAWCETEKGGEDYEISRAQMTAEVAAACQAILDSGADVVVRDGHDSARNIIHRDLPRGTKLMRGWAAHPGSMVAGIDEKYDGLLFVGYHSPGGISTNPLAHTNSDSKIIYTKLNGKLVSEFTLNRNFAAQFGVPAIFISGDKGICDIAKEELPDIETIAVKEGKGNSTFNMHPLDACDAIYEGVKKALAKEHEAPVLPEKFELEIRLKNHFAARQGLCLPGVELLDDYTVRYVAKTQTEYNIVREYVTR